MKELNPVRVPFYTEVLHRGTECTDTAELENVQRLLQDYRVNQLASEGLLTLALIRPNVGPDANLMGLDDNTIANKIEESIRNMGILAKFSFTFDSEAVELFYSGEPHAVMSKLKPYHYKKYSNKWHEFIAMMTGGTSTALLLTSENATNVWRSHIGGWDVDNNRDTETIRGKFATNNYNDLVHGSDDQKSVITELSIIQNCIRRRTLMK